MQHIRTISIVLFAALLVACAPAAPSVESVQTAIAQTQAANPTATLPAATPTASPVPTATPTLTLTPTATPDLRVIDINPRDLVLSKEDLPPEGKYYQPTGWAYGPVTNSEIISSWTVEEGQAYIARSGRVQGWETEFGRGSSKAVLPDDIWNEAVIYETGAAASAAVVEDQDCTRFDDTSPVKIEFTIGDIVAICMERDVNGVHYILVFAYRNALGMFHVWGSEVEVTPLILRSLAEKQLGNFMQQPLSEEVTFAP